MSRAAVLLPALMLLIEVRPQWTQVSVPYAVDLFSFDSYSSAVMAMGASSCWLESTNGGATWDSIPILDGGGLQEIGVVFLAMQYVDATNMVSTGLTFSGTYPFQVRRSTNAGGNWSLEYNSPGNGAFTAFRGMSWWTAGNALVVGDLGRIIRSTDGGDTWTVVYNTGNTLHDVALSSLNNAVAVGNGRILRSSNGGANWTSQLSTSAQIYGVHFPAAVIGFACGEDGALWSTVDGGINWTAVDAQLPDDVDNFDDVWFVSASEGYVLSDGNILHSTDGGVHWEWFPCGSAPLHELHFQSATNGFAVGDDATLWRTSAGGAYHPYALFDAPGTTICPGVATTFTNNSAPGLNSAWSINGTPVSSSTDLVWTFNVPGQQDTVTLVVDNGVWSDTLARVVTIAASTAIELDAGITNDTVCGGDNTLVQVFLSQSGTTYRLRRGSVNIGVAQNGNGGTLTFNSGAIVTFDTLNVLATRVVPDCATLRDSVYFPVALGDPITTLDVSPVTITICGGDDLPITVEDTQLEVSYQLRFNGTPVGAPQQGNGGTLTFTVGPLSIPGTYSILATHLNGCSVVLATTTTVAVETPILAWGPTSLNPLVGAPVDLMNSSNTLGGGYEWIINNGTPSSSTDEEPIGVVFNTPGITTVQLIGITPLGCRDTLEQILHVIAIPAPVDCGVTQWASNEASTSDLSVALDGQGNMYGWQNLSYANEVVALSGAGDTMYLVPPVEDDYVQHGLLFKYDAFGIPQWHVDFWQTSTLADAGDVATDADGNVFTAYFYNAYLDSLRITAADGQRTTLDPPSSGSYFRSVVVSSFDPQGRLRWVNTFLDTYTTPVVHVEVDGQGDVLAHGLEHIWKFDGATGAALWDLQDPNDYNDVTATSDDHVWVTQRDLVLSEYDAGGALVFSTPPHPFTPPEFGLARLVSVACVKDGADDLYQWNAIAGEVIIGNDTLTGDASSLGDLPSTYFLSRREAGTADFLWTLPISTWSPLSVQGLALHDGRLFALVFTFNADTMRIEGLDPVPIAPGDSWLISCDLNGGTPNATPVSLNNDPLYPDWVNGVNALATNGTDIAMWTGFDQPYAVGTDTAFAYSGFDLDLPHDLNTYALVYGDIDCLFPRLPEPGEAPQALFEPPQNICAGQPVTFVDASWNGPTSWYWEFPGGDPPTSTYPVVDVIYDLPGSYTVTLTTSNANGISAPFMANVVVEVCTGVAMEQQGSWSVAPVPANESIVFMSPSPGPCAAICMDRLGRRVWQGTVASGTLLSTAHWPAGIYTIRIQGDQGLSTLRFMIAH